ncbi:MAG: carbamoyltransferase HypF [Candidatus Methanomethylophilaceae archaeon]|nr:hydrogenase maturation protein HypF [Candidatus Methanomethylophilaceae archaeon]
MTKPSGVRILIKGTVQGVGFRPAVYRAASKLGIRGRVWNSGSDVIIEAERDGGLLRELYDNLPPLAVIEDVSVTEMEMPHFKEFSIVGSSSGGESVSIPTDTAICDTCLHEIRSPGRRSGYAFTSCTDCGARFTLLSALPYDRQNTSMSEFPVCPECRKEFDDPAERRFHHQTICCPVCGPSYYLLDHDGSAVPGDPIQTFAGMLSDGNIGIAKSWGGMHICCTLDNIGRLRDWYDRPQKPFAIMARDMDALKKYGRPNDDEIREIMSPHRPIVLVDKNDAPENVAPGLDNIGIFLPYTGMQHLLFDNMREDALVMTSANPPGEPMITDDSEILEMGADMYLLHNQDIINRADDSVLRIYKGHSYFIRKSRGNIPSSIETDPELRGNVVGIGAQENLTGAVSKGSKIYQTQYIGHGASIGVPEYLESSIRNLLNLTGATPEIVAGDLHPGYSNRRVSRKLVEEYDIPYVDVQHHWAHAASLLADNKKMAGTVLSMDGTGYGSDGNAWGGEVISTDLTKYTRDAHLEYVPLLGSEKALYDLKRLKFAVDVMNGRDNELFSDQEASVMRKLMRTSVKTSSMGRLLDTLAFTLGVCSVRTYDGEPAMKLEPLLARGKLISGYETDLINGTIRTVHLFDRIRRSDRPEDIAYSIVYNVMDKLTEAAVDAADRNGYKYIGISGGVSYNSVISRIFEEIGQRSDHELIFHNRVPNGDGGISTGQAAIAQMMIG